MTTARRRPAKRLIGGGPARPVSPTGMLDWRPYHHRNARRLFRLVSIGVGIVATGIDLAHPGGHGRR